jgi:hypothetical protein
MNIKVNNPQQDDESPTQTAAASKDKTPLQGEKSSAQTVVTLKDKTPCNWNITASEGDSIAAVNISTGEVFEGDIKSFSKALRG